MHTDVIVSFTTHKPRMSYIPGVVNSLLEQTYKPYKICLTVYNGDLPYITPEIWELINSKQIELIKCDEDLAPHKKYYYAMLKYPDYPIITFDDDIIYDNDVVETLVNSYEKFPKCISARRVHKIQYDENDMPLKYMQWFYQYTSYNNKPSFDLFATNGAGVLFPPNILDIHTLSIDKIKECLYADDVFLKWRENELNIPVVWVRNDNVMSGKVIPGSDDTGLAKLNLSGGRNNEYIKKFGLKKKKNRVIYTCITGGDDELLPIKYITPGFDYICFTDDLTMHVPYNWQLRPIPEELQGYSKVKQQRLIKIQPHKYLPEYEESIWIDGSIEIVGDLNRC